MDSRSPSDRTQPVGCRLPPSRRAFCCSSLFPRCYARPRRCSSRCSAAVFLLLLINSEIASKPLITGNELVRKIRHNSGEKTFFDYQQKTAGSPRSLWSGPLGPDRFMRGM